MKKELNGLQRVILFIVLAAPFFVLITVVPDYGNVVWGYATFAAFILAAIGLLLANFL